MLVRGVFDAFRGGAKHTAHEAAHIGTEAVARDSLHAASGATTSAVEGSTRDMLHATENIVTSAEGSEVRAAAASEVETAAKKELHPITNPARVPNKYDGMRTRNVLMGSAVAVPAVTSAAVGSVLTVRAFNRGEQMLQAAPGQIEKGLETVSKPFVELFKHLPNPSDIEQAAQKALHGAHNIGSDLARPAETAITIGTILLAGVIVYEVYTRF